MVIALIWLGYSPVNHVAATEDILMAMGCCLCPHAIIASNKMLPKCDEHGKVSLLSPSLKYLFVTSGFAFGPVLFLMVRIRLMFLCSYGV